MARRALHPFDLTLRHGKTWQVLRRGFLTFSVLLTWGLPLWNLSVLRGDSRLGLTPFVGAPTSIAVFGIELVDPAEALAVALFRGPSWALVWTVLPGLALVVVLGRFFCGWACPYLPILALANASRWLLHRLGFEPMDRRLPRVTSRTVLVGVLVVGAITGMQLMPVLYPPAIIGREAFRFAFTGAFGLGLAVVAAAFLFDTFVSRAGFCRSICPGGAMFSVVASASPVHVHNEHAKCTDCTACDVICNLAQSPMTNTLDSGCERCGRCVSVCPTGALSWKVRR